MFIAGIAGADKRVLLSPFPCETLEEAIERAIEMLRSTVYTPSSRAYVYELSQPVATIKPRDQKPQNAN